MSQWIRWAAPAAALVSVTSAAHAVQYLSLAQAQKLAFPSATRFVEVQAGRVWKAQAGERVIGLFVFDRVIGKHLYIDYTVAIDPGGQVHRVDILQYRESYGGEVRQASWLAQFVGKTSASPLQVDRDIRNISGATLSSHHVAEGVKRVLSLYGHGVR
ncbi:MAG TPA: FMN-binding protein [Xanthobacteraceae bacterium]|jgi:Na+-translocating ferredoxin:NAD+ oxidoreductase RnfG subunit|nr:FMN-binding protein [Xanthobacteraceae bacterium]